MSNDKIPQSLPPDKLDRVLRAGYAFKVEASTSGRTVLVNVYRGQHKVKMVVGDPPALVVFDHAIDAVLGDLEGEGGQ